MDIIPNAPDFFGHLEVRGSTIVKWKKLYCVLKANRFICYSKKKDTEELNIDLRRSFFTVEGRVMEKDNCFAIRNPHIIYMSAPTPDELGGWLTALKRSNYSKQYEQLDIHKVKPVKGKRNNVNTHTPHYFCRVHFNSATWCDWCGKFIWGVVSKQGYRCSACDYVAHPECIDEVHTNCGSVIVDFSLLRNTSDPSMSSESLMKTSSLEESSDTSSIKIGQRRSHDDKEFLINRERKEKGEHRKTEHKEKKEHKEKHKHEHREHRHEHKHEARDSNSPKESPQQEHAHVAGENLIDFETIPPKEVKQETKVEQTWISKSLDQSPKKSIDKQIAELEEQDLAKKLESADFLQATRGTSLLSNADDPRPEIDPDQIKWGPLIGTGAFGEVYSCTLMGQEVAVKVLNAGPHLLLKEDWESFLQSFKAEIRIMSKITHPNILLYMGACTTVPGKLMIVTDKMSTDLESLLMKNQAQIPVVQKLRLIRDAVRGIAWLHSRNPSFLHLDLKPANLLMNNSGKVVVGDFGQTIVKSRDTEKTIHAGSASMQGTPFYMSPEMFLGEEVTVKSDIYSLGIVMWEIMYQKRAFSNQSFIQLLADITERNIRPPLEPSGDFIPSERFKRLVTSCWDSLPDNRPDIQKVLEEIDQIILEYAIEDNDGREFWSTNFSNKESVSWEQFYSAISERLPLPPATAKLVRKSIEAIFAESEVALGITPKKMVSMTHFGSMLATFGPFVGQRHFGVRLYELLRCRWFHGALDQQEAYNRISSHRSGTFLIRLSTKPGWFTLTRKKDHRQIIHSRIQYDVRSGVFIADKQKYFDLQSFVKANSEDLKLQNPCPNSPFEYLFVGDDLVDNYDTSGTAIVNNQYQQL